MDIVYYKFNFCTTLTDFSFKNYGLYIVPGSGACHRYPLPSLRVVLQTKRRQRLAHRRIQMDDTTGKLARDPLELSFEFSKIVRVFLFSQ